MTGSSSYHNIASSSSSLDVSSPTSDCRLSAGNNLTYAPVNDGDRLMDRRSRSVADLTSECTIKTHDISLHKSRAATLTHKSTAAAAAAAAPDGTPPRSPAHKLLGCLWDFRSKRMRKKHHRRQVAATDADDNRNRMPSV